jgi:UDP-N-acetylmuramoyl-L-alanyl-D-glutamate--2,6-diaminopimelate ligase|nr:UDP-N-acetylmuramoyl-L-alanyl-D-glutamate--2,6-diaminopimelate ligase [Candidatus Acidoferrales bacterium]
MLANAHLEPDTSAKSQDAAARPESLTVRELLAGISTSAPISSAEAERKISGIAYNSKQVTQGSAFFAIRGEATDGNLYVFDAAARGATAIISELPRPTISESNPEWQAVFARTGIAAERKIVPANVTWIQVPQARKALSLASANLFRHPAAALNLIGITGTSGKTTTSFLVDSILRAAGITAGLFGTVVYRTPRAEIHATNTTPESYEMQRFFSELRDSGATAGVMEVSSHALAMDRLWGCHFDVAVFTNLTSDHLDYHNTIEDYFAAKRQLFEGTGAGKPRVAVLNSDDPRAKHLAGLAEHAITFGMTNGAKVITRNFTPSFSGLQFTAQTPSGNIEVRSPLVGRINVYNILCAIATGLALEISPKVIEQGIAQLQAVPGRFERIDCGQPFLVIVDYAHTDDSLRKLLTTARELHPEGRIITLFGNGGDRDRTKRPAMGETAGRASDLVVLTVDNPRREDPLRTINDAVVGVQRTRTPYKVEPDRARAIGIAFDEARAGDIVLLVGKGHETYQIMKDGPVHFDERGVARQLLYERGYGNEKK